MAERMIKLPDVGEGVAEVEIVELRVKTGDPVREGDVLAAVMTDKATVEIPSPADGRVLWIGPEVGQKAAVGLEPRRRTWSPMIRCGLMRTLLVLMVLGLVVSCGETTEEAARRQANEQAYMRMQMARSQEQQRLAAQRAAQEAEYDRVCLAPPTPEWVGFFAQREHYLAIMRSAIALNASYFNTQRMLLQYLYAAYGTQSGEAT